MTTVKTDTLDAAIEWLAKAQQLGFYKANVARLLRAGADAIRGVLADDEDRSVDRVARDLGSLHDRLLNRAGSINQDTARTYVARTKRLLNDYRGWLKDPKAYQPSRRSRRSKAKLARSPARGEVFPVGDEAPSAGGEAGGAGAHRDHTLSLSTGKAYLRLPATLSTEDVALLTLVIRSHGPPAPDAAP